MSEADGSIGTHAPEKNNRRIGENARSIADALARIRDLEETVQDQQDIIEDLQRGTTADNYEAMTAKEREQKIAQALRTKAEGNKLDGASMDYSEIVALFENEIPNASAYKLMQRLDNRDGYEYQKRAKRTPQTRAETAPKATSTHTHPNRSCIVVCLRGLIRHG